MNKLGMKILTMVGLISLVSMCILVISNIYIFQSMFSNLQKDAKNIVNESISSIDAAQLQEVIDSESMDSLTYQQIQQSMIDFRSSKDIKYFYTMTLGENMAHILVDSAQIDTSPIGEEFYLEDAMRKSFAGENTYTKTPVTDEYGSFISAYAPIKNAKGEIIAIAGVDKDVTSFISIKSQLTKSTLFLAVILIMLSILMSLIFSRRLSTNVRILTTNLSSMSEGNLTKEITLKSGDETETIATSINSVREKTAETLRQLSQSVGTVEEGIHKLSSVSKEMATSSEEVAITVQEVAKGMDSESEEMTKITNRITNFGTKINETVSAINEINSKVEIINTKAQASNQDLTTMEDTITGINDSFAGMQNEIHNLSEYISQVSEVTDIIDNIAKQTNLLALNASIEASRAGESGKGFSVVAEEVRRLAEQSKVSASNISNLLVNIKTNSDSVAVTSDTMKQRLNEQMKAIRKSVKSFKVIINNVEDIIPQINAVNSNMDDINVDKEHIIESIKSTTEMTEQVAASAEEIAASTEELSASTQEVAMSTQALNKISNEMAEMIRYFKL